MSMAFDGIGALDRRWVAAAFVGAALAGGASWWHPRLAAGAWAWAALLTVGLLGARSAGRAALAGWVASVAVLGIGYDWVDEMMEITAGYTSLEATAFAWAQFATYGFFPAAALGLAAAGLRRRVPAALWVPTAWVAGEWLRFEVVSISIDDWLATQWQVEPALRALGRIGYWPTTWLGLCACAAVGDALVRRRWRRAAPALLVGAAALALPPLPSRGLDALEGIAAVYTADAVTLPHRAPPGEALDLVVWPEDALALDPYLGEGHTPGARIDPLLPDSPARHVIGLVTRLPRGLRQNQAVAVEADGAVIASRAKRLLMPVTERRFAGLGHDGLWPGAASTALTLPGRALVAVICGELLSRALVAEGVAAGGEVIVAPARDQMMVNDRALRHLMAVQVLRSVEFGRPSVRASLGGWASFVGSDGRVLARSARGQSGFLMWDRHRGARAVDFFGRPAGSADPPAPADTVVLYARDAPRFRARCPAGRCAYVAIEDFVCDGRRAKTVIVSGHGQPPTSLSRPAAEVGAAVRCLAPELVVLDTCYGASADLFAALGDLPAIAVGSTRLVPPSGLAYGPAFFGDGDAQTRARAVSTPAGPLTRWPVDPAGLAAARAAAEALSDAEVGARIARRTPPQIRAALGAAGEVLVPIDPARLGAHGMSDHRARVLRQRRTRGGVPAP